MCDPVTMMAANFAIGAASTVASFAGQSAAAEEQAAYNRRAEAAAIQSRNDSFKATQDRMSQEQEAAGLAKQDAWRETRSAMATAKVAAGEANVSGLSVNHLLADYYGRGAEFSDRTDAQTEWTMGQLQASQKGVRAQAQDRINSLPTPQKPSFIDAGLRILGQGAQTYGSFKKLTDPDWR